MVHKSVYHSRCHLFIIEQADPTAEFKICGQYHASFVHNCLRRLQKQLRRRPVHGNVSPFVEYDKIEFVYLGEFLAQHARLSCLCEFKTRAAVL